VKVPPVNMRCENPRSKGLTCVWRKRSISSERHLPINRITSVSTPAQSRALAPESRRQRAVTSVGKKPSDDPRKRTASLMVSVTIAGLTLSTELSALYQWASGVRSGA